MTDKTKAAEWKAKGNAEFSAQNFEEAIGHFTKAIEYDNTDAVFFSNRSACYASLEKYQLALDDANKAVELRPDWFKAYSRKAHAEFFLGKHDEAEKSYEKGISFNANDETLKNGLKNCKEAKARKAGGGMPPGGISPELMKLAATNPKILEYMKDPAFLKKFQTLMMLQSQGQSNPASMQALLPMFEEDPRLMEVFLALMGSQMPDGGPGGDAGGSGGLAGASSRAAEARRREEEKRKKEKELEKKKKEEEEQAKLDARPPEQKEADEWKAKGNELYKKREFDAAIEMYDKAIAACPNDIMYYTNKAAVLIEKAEYDECIQMLSDLLEKRYEMNTAFSGGASFEKVAKVYVRMASCYQKQKKFDKALEMYEKSLTEDNNRLVRNQMRDCQKAKDKFDEVAYVDEEKAEVHREKGNELFKKQKYAESKVEYDEAIRRNPKDAKLYSNRAAALTKLLAHPDALRDLDKCLELDPTFVKAYSRKGACHFFMKDYNKAIAVYEKGLSIDASNEECIKGLDAVKSTIMNNQNSKEVDEEQIRQAMNDPEIQKIRSDPQINMVLQTLQENPAAGQKMMMEDPQIAAAINKLIVAGIIKVG